MGVVRAVTLLEDLCIGIKAEYDRFNFFAGSITKTSAVDNDDPEGLYPRALYRNLGFKEDLLDGTEPLYNYFSKVRNCIVHRSGRATTELSGHAISPRLIAWEIALWNKPRACGAIISILTLAPPEDSPKSVTFPGSPPN